MNNKKLGLTLICLSLSLSVASIALSGWALNRVSQNKGYDSCEDLFSVAQVLSEYGDFSSEKATAFVIDGTGSMITNCHSVTSSDSEGNVVSASVLKVRFPDEEDYSSADVVCFDPSLDLALIRSASASGRKGLSFSAGQSGYGDPCYALSNTNNLGISEAKGIVSIPSIDISVDGETQNYIQSNIDIGPGSSGGCLLSEKGEVIGMVSFRLRDDSGDVIAGFGYSIPSARLHEYAESAVDL